MATRRTLKEEYEIVAYPKLNHVRASIVQIVNRNTHIHQAFELGLVLAGEAKVRVGDKSFAIRTGSLFFFNANEPHEIIASNREGVRIAYLQVASGFCGDYLSCFRNLEISENELTHCLTPDQHYALMERMVQSLMNYMDESGDLQALRCIRSICDLFVGLLSYVPYRQISEAAYLARNKKMARLARITEYINENYAEKITLETLARKERVTPTYLSHFIHDNLNMTFQEYVATQRFERALKLLRNTTMCLTDVSVVCGFSDVKYLSKMLEKHFGSSAKNCRSQLCLRQEQDDDLAQAQTFATEEIARNWLSAFWDEQRAQWEINHKEKGKG